MKILQIVPVFGMGGAEVEESEKYEADASIKAIMDAIS